MRAARGTQTLDLVITNHSFYQLNYRGIKYAVQDSNPHQQGRNLSFCPVRLTAYKCTIRDSNPYAFRHMILSHACLPVPAIVHKWCREMELHHPRLCHQIYSLTRYYLRYIPAYNYQPLASHRPVLLG